MRHQLRHLHDGERELSTIDLEELSLSAQPLDLKWWLSPSGDDNVEPRRRVPAERLDEPGGWARPVELMRVIDHEHEIRRELRMQHLGELRGERVGAEELFELGPAAPSASQLMSLGMSGTRRRSASLSCRPSVGRSRSWWSAVYQAQGAVSHHDASSVDLPNPASATTTVRRRLRAVATSWSSAGRSMTPSVGLRGRIFAIGVASTIAQVWTRAVDYACAGAGRCEKSWKMPPRCRRLLISAIGREPEDHGEAGHEAALDDRRGASAARVERRGR